MDTLNSFPGVTADEDRDFDTALAEFVQLLDFDGDGVPDALVPAEGAQRPPEPMSPSEGLDMAAGFGLGAVDVLGIPSAIAGRVFGEDAKAAMRGPQERNPGASLMGAFAVPANAMAAGVGAVRGANLAQRGNKAMEGARNAMASPRPGLASPHVDEAERIFATQRPMLGNAATNTAIGGALGAGADVADRGEIDPGAIAVNAMLGGASGLAGTGAGFLARRGSDPQNEINAMRTRVPEARSLERQGTPNVYAAGPPVRAPQGEGLPPRSPGGREEYADFYANLYRDQAVAYSKDGPRLFPGHVRGIQEAETATGRFRGPQGRFVSDETGMTAKKLGFPKKR